MLLLSIDQANESTDLILEHTNFCMVPITCQALAKLLSLYIVLFDTFKEK